MAPDPKEEVPGDLAAIDETRTTMAKLGAAFENAAQGFQKINTGGWSGATADAFADYYRQEPPKWFRAADAFTEAAEALGQYRDVLAWAQQQAEKACADLARAEKQTEQAQAQHEKSGSSTPFQDPAAAARNQAQATLDAAKEQVEQAAAKAASILLKAAEKAPPTPGLLTMLASGVEDVWQNTAEAFGEFWQGSLEGSLEMIQQLRAISPFDPYNLTHPTQYAKNIGELASTTIAAAKTFVSDPIGTTKAMVGAGIDSFTKDPFATLGKLAPEVATGLATGGGSAVGRAGSMAHKVFEGVKEVVTPDKRKAEDWDWTPDYDAPTPQPSPPPAAQPHNVPAHQPPLTTSTHAGQSAPSPNHANTQGAPPTSGDPRGWNHTDHSVPNHTTPDSSRGAHHEPYTRPAHQPDASGPHAPPDNHRFGPRGSDWSHHDTQHTASHADDTPRPARDHSAQASRSESDQGTWKDPHHRGGADGHGDHTPTSPDHTHQGPGTHEPGHHDDEHDTPRPDQDAPSEPDHDEDPKNPDERDAEPSSPGDDDRPRLDELFPEPGGHFDADRALAAFRDALDGQYGDLNLNVSVKDIFGFDNKYQVFADITDSSGRNIGEIHRIFERHDDGITAHHNRLELNPEFQGAGFAKEFNGTLENWYRASGVNEIKLLANIDVGSYAWARQGYEFASQSEAVSDILPRLRNEIARAEDELNGLRQGLHQPGVDADTLRREIITWEQTLKDARDVEARFFEGSDRFPTPREISELGRPKDLESRESRDLQWLGKNVLLGTDERTGTTVRWNGVKRL
ncbi:putative T7SS-secreted protein [Saccharopolyspora thermophila]|uniref:Putative T7SS secretion signal domain-containing protein n=1 Tax=Saccharopolyspora thermophila TaxID=89367 RepID=A0ABP3LR86_9PSEU